MTQVTTLQDLCEAVIDCPHSTPKWTDTGVLVLRSQNIRNGRLALDEKSFTDEVHYRDRSRRAELREGDLVITREAPMGEVCMLPRGLRCCLGQRMVMLRPDSDRCDGRYLLYALQSPGVQEQISWSEGTGSTVSNLRIPHLKALLIPTPPKAQQAAIGCTLGALDDKIEQNRRTAQALEKLVRAIFRAWFVDFEPVKAKAAGATSFPSMPQPAFAALPTRLIDSTIGPVPEGWELASIYDFADVTYGAPFSSKLFNDAYEGVPLIRIRDLRTHEPKTFTTELHSNGALVRPADIVVGMDGEFRLHYWLGPDAWLNQRLCRIDVKAEIPRMFVGEALRSPLEYFERAKTGTTVIHLGKSDIDTIQLIRPTSSVLDAFGRTTDQLLGLIVQSTRESCKLAAMRDCLLPKLLSGSVRVEVGHG